MLMKNETICWDCDNACGKCSWSDGTFTPVKGWEATPTIINNSDGKLTESYCVHKCPLFKNEFNFKLVQIKDILKLLKIDVKSFYLKKYEHLRKLQKRGYDVVVFQSGKIERIMIRKRGC